jgi:hypothetical protein
MIIVLVIELGQLLTGISMDIGHRFDIDNSSFIFISFIVFFTLGLFTLKQLTK